MQKMLFQLLRGFYAYSAAWKRIGGTGNERRRKRWINALIKASAAAGLEEMPESLTEEIMATVDTNRASLSPHCISVDRADKLLSRGRPHQRRRVFGVLA
jgi:hypothetical protein